MSEARLILGGMGRTRIRVPGPVFADALFCIGQAWLKRRTGDMDGAGDDLADAAGLIPVWAVEEILFMIEDGSLPDPGEAAGAEAWLEKCRQAGAGEFTLVLGLHTPDEPARSQETEAEFLAQLARIRADAEAQAGTATAAEPAPAKPVSLADELRNMGLM
jgi:hypothetical protein